MCTREDMLARYLGTLSLDDVMSYIEIHMSGIIIYLDKLAHIQAFINRRYLILLVLLPRKHLIKIDWLF